MTNFTRQISCKELKARHNFKFCVIVNIEKMCQWDIDSLTKQTGSRIMMDLKRGDTVQLTLIMFYLLSIGGWLSHGQSCHISYFYI